MKSVIYQVPVCAISNIDAAITPEGTHFMPGTQGGVNWNGPAYSPLTPTAGGLLLTADLEGNLLAFDAATGEVILKKNLGDPIGGGVITYSVAGRQYVAVAVGMKNYLMKTQSGPASIAILALPE